MGALCLAPSGAKTARANRRSLALWAATVLGALSAGAAPFDFTGPVTSISAIPGTSKVTLDAIDPNAGGLVRAEVASGGTSDLTTVGSVAAWSSGTTVFFYVYDAYQKKWVGASSSTGGTFDLANTNGIVAWTSGTTARYAAYDWGRGMWRTDSAPIGSPATSFNLIDGIAAGSTGAGVFFAAYDPRAGIWKKGSVASGAPGEMINTNGIVAWTVAATVYCLAYDPLSGTWKANPLNAGGIPFDLRNASGVVAFTRNPVVAYAAFDGARGAWANGSVNAGFTSDLTVSNATVAWSTSTQAYRRGYDGPAGVWTPNVAKPLAFFLASTNSGNAPLVVTFIDLSTGGRLWAWNFGDSAGTSVRRSPIYRFTGFGQFLVTETVSGDGGVSATNLLIRTDTVAPAGTVTINNGDAVTTNVNVMLQLSATDNSGTVAAMRFSNDETNWSDWETFGAAKAWTLAPGGGQKTVFAQFRDTAGNVSASATDTIELDATPPPVISFISTNVVESAGSVTVTAALDHPVNRAVSANYATSNGTANNGEDYTGRSGLLLFAPNIRFATITIPILADFAVELDETIFLNLSNPTNGVLGTPGTVTIIDDDLASVAFGAPNFNAGEDAGNATVSVRLNAASGQTISVRVQSRSGTAMDGADFVSTNVLLVFLPGQTNRTFNIPILEDLVDELTETISLSLTNLTNGVIGVPAQSTVSILDNDQPILFFSAENYSGYEDDFSIAVHVRLSKPYSQQVSAGYTITGGSATPGIDYTILGTVIIPASTTNATITVFPINDVSREPDETIRLRLTDIAGASPGRTETTVTILDEDGAPRFVSSARDGAAFRCSLRGRPDLVFEMHTSTNLADWTLLRTLTNSAMGTCEFSAPASDIQRYYKSFVSP